MKETMISQKTYAAPNVAAFGSNEPKKIDKIDPVQNPTVLYPGPGTYEHDMSSLQSTHFKVKKTWNMMSNTLKAMPNMSI